MELQDLLDSISKNKNQILLKGAPVAGAALGDILSGGLDSGVGNTISTVGSTAGSVIGAFNPVAGSIVSGASSLVGGLTNKMFGSNINQLKVSSIDSQNKSMQNTVIQGSSNEDVLNQLDNQDFGQSFSRKDIGKDGWFSNKAKNKFKEMQRKQEDARSSLLSSYGNAFGNIDTNNDLNLLANYSAEGGSIHIKESKKGTFTAAAKRHGKSVQEFAALVLRNKENYSPAMRKKANFARNASKWHSDGGFLNSINTGEDDREYYNNYINSYPDFNLDKVGKMFSGGGDTNEDSYCTTFGSRFVPLKFKNITDMAWAGSELVPVLGNILGIADVGNDVYNMANSNDTSFGDLANLGLDIAGLIPGIGTLSKASKIAKLAKAEKTANKLSKAAENLSYTHGKGLKQVRKRVEDAKDFITKGKKASTDAVLRGNLNSAVRDSWRAQLAAAMSLGILLGVQKAIDPFWNNYNIIQNVGTKVDAVNDATNFVGSLYNQKAQGGFMNNSDFNNGVTDINTGGSHEQNPYGGVLYGTDNLGIPNRVELGEVVYKDYAYSDRLKVPVGISDLLKVSGKNNTFADAAKQLLKESKERPNDPISQRGLQDSMAKLAAIQEQLKETKQAKQYARQLSVNDGIDNIINNTIIDNSINGNTQQKQFANGGDMSDFVSYLDYNYWNDRAGFGVNTSKDYTNPFGGNGYGGKYNPKYELNLPTIPNVNIDQNPRKTYNGSNPYGDMDGSILRYAPIVGSALGVLSDLLGNTNKPDYGNADRVERAASGARGVSYTPIGDYIKPSLFDRNYWANSLNANTAAQRRAALSLSGGNRATAMANLAAVNYNAMNQLGALAALGLKYNDDQRLQAATFNRGTNQMNSQMSLEALKANMMNNELSLKAALIGALMRDTVDSRVSAARSANLTNFFNNLGKLGIDIANKKDMQRLIKTGALHDLYTALLNLLGNKEA